MKLVDNEELMKWMRGDPVIYIRNGKDWKKGNNLSDGIDIVSAQTR